MREMRFSGKEVSRYWDENADLWTEHVRKGWDVYREHFNNPAFFEFIGDLSGKDVLDAGCGEGYNTRIMARRGARITGIDISEKMIAYAREEERCEPLGIRYELASFSDISIFPDESFDDVVSFMALMDGPDYESAVREFHRVLKPEGELFYSVTHPCFVRKGMEWITDESGECVKLATRGYFSTEPWLAEWKFSKAPIPKDTPPFQVPAFDKTFSEYINILLGAGFLLRRIHEPQPTEEMCREHPWLRRFRDVAACFLYVRAGKP